MLGHFFMNTQQKIPIILDLLRKATTQMTPPMSSSIIELYGKDPFLILISCLLSLRARDVITLPVSKQLFSLARTPEELSALPLEKLETIFYPLGFYRKKARLVKEVSVDLLKRFNGKVPATMEELLSIKGVGRKTANLVLGYAFDVPSICVDTHVHRVSNRLGIVATRTTEQTEYALQKIVPQQYWTELNTLLVVWGQNICVPLSPFCSKCVLNPLCPKIGVTKRR